MRDSSASIATIESSDLHRSNIATFELDESAMALPDRYLGEGFYGTAMVCCPTTSSPFAFLSSYRVSLLRRPDKVGSFLAIAKGLETLQGYGAMSLSDFATPEVVSDADDTLRHVLQSGVTVIDTAGLLAPPPSLSI